MADYVGHGLPRAGSLRPSYYTGDDAAWCRLAMAFCMSVAGMEPVFRTNRRGALDVGAWPASESDRERRAHASPELGCVASSPSARERRPRHPVREARGRRLQMPPAAISRTSSTSPAIDPGTVVALVWPEYRMRPDIFTPESDHHRSCLDTIEPQPSRGQFPRARRRNRTDDQGPAVLISALSARAVSRRRRSARSTILPESLGATLAGCAVL